MMEEVQIEDLLSDLISSSQTCVYNALLKIQQLIVTDVGLKQFNNADGISVLVAVVHEPNEITLDVAITVLETCSMDKDCAAMLMKWPSLQHIGNIITSTVNDNILYRACKVLDNILKFMLDFERMKDIYALGVLSSLLKKIADDETSFKVPSPTLSMIIKALRLLCNNYDDNCTTIFMENIIFVVIKYTPMWMKNEEKELLEIVLDYLLFYFKYTKHIFATTHIEENGFKCMVSLISSHPNAEKIVNHMIRNKYVTSSSICLPEVVSKIVVSLKQHAESSPAEKWPQNELMALCLFCKYEKVRIEVSNAGGLPVLLSLIKNCPSNDQLQQVLHALVHFIDNETDFNVLLNEGLVSIVVQVLGNFIKYMNCYHEEKLLLRGDSYLSNFKTITWPVKFNKSQSSKITAQAKRVIDDDGEENLYNQKKCRIENNSSPTLFDYQLSPQPSSSCYSPVSSPEQENCDSDSEESVNYLQICSDLESEDEESVNDLQICSDSESEDEEFINYFSLVPSVLNDSYSDQNVDENKDYFKEIAQISKKNIKTIIVSSLLILLSRAVYMEKTDLSFPHSNTLDILLYYIQLDSKIISGRAARILLSVVRRGDNFIILLKNKFIITLYNLINSLPHPDFCEQCYQIKKTFEILNKNFITLAQSDFGTRQLSVYFVKSDTDFRELLSIEIPYIIQSKHLLHILFIRYGGLDLLLNVIIEKKLHLYLALTALRILFTKLKIKDPKCNSSMVSVNFVDGDYKIDKYDSEIVTFILDDFSIVHAKKDVLVKKSDYFRTLLTGDFKESKEDIVYLKNVTQDGLKYLLVLLDHIDQNSDAIDRNSEAIDRNSEVAFPLCSTLSVDLEVLVLLDRYLLENLARTLNQVVLERMLVAFRAAEIYAWSVDSNTDILRNETIAFVVAGDMIIEEREYIFQSVKRIGYLDQFINDIRQLFNRCLNMRN